MIPGIVVAVGLAALSVALFTRRRSHDDEHSVAHYHKQLHTLQGINAHPAGSDLASGSKGTATPAFPGSALRLAGSSTVRLTEPGRPIGPAPVPPPVAEAMAPTAFDDVKALPPPGAGPLWLKDRTVHAINHRPRRLAAPAAAMGVALLIVAILLITGSHQVVPARGQRSTANTHTQRHSRVRHHTTTIAAPIVSAPGLSSTYAATYTVGVSSFSLGLSATSGSCWVEATDSAGTVLFTGILGAGQSHTVAAAGPVSVIAGAPAMFAATVNGKTVTLPSGFLAPFTLHFVPTSVSG